MVVRGGASEGIPGFLTRIHIFGYKGSCCLRGYRPQRSFPCFVLPSSPLRYFFGVKVIHVSSCSCRRGCVVISRSSASAKCWPRVERDQPDRPDTFFFFKHVRELENLPSADATLPREICSTFRAVGLVNFYPGPALLLKHLGEMTTPSPTGARGRREQKYLQITERARRADKTRGRLLWAIFPAASSRFGFTQGCIST